MVIGRIFRLLRLSRRARRLVPLLLGLGAVGAVSCTGDHSPVPGAIPVLFRDAGVREGTRAGSSFIDNAATAYIPAGTALALWGWVGEEAAGTPDFMNGTRVVNEGGSVGGVFSYAPVKYWPSDGETPLSFIAAWPYGAPGMSFSLSGTDPALSFSVASSAASQVDLLVASSEDNGCPSDGALALAFHHTLSKVTVSATAEAAFALNGMRAEVTEAVLVGPKAAGSLDPLSGAWTPSGDGTSYVCGLGGTAAETLLLIPQPTDTLSFRVAFTVHYLDGAGTEVSSSSHVITAPVPATAGRDYWEAGKAYSYSLLLHETHLEVSVSVAPWDLDESSYSYTSEVGIADGGLFAWQAESYSVIDNGGHRVVTAFDTDLVGSFEIETPEGATWYALLESTGGDAGAFMFVDSGGNLSPTAHGTVGERATIRIRQTTPYPAETNTAVLSFVVRWSGRTIPVTALVDNAGHNWTIIQNANS